MRRIVIGALAAAILSMIPRLAAAQETCGDAVDQGSNNMVDEGCDPYAVTGVCESPLSCATTGSIAPKMGSLVYRVRPDVSVDSVYGPDLVFQRFYTSMYDPGYFPGGKSDHQDHLGYRWQHGYMSWITDLGGSPQKVVLHTTDGRDVLFTYDSSLDDGTYYYFVPQKGFYVKHLRKLKTSPTTWELKSLHGGSQTYNISDGKLTAITDSVGKSLSLTYSNGKLSRVTDATGNRYLDFVYQTAGEGTGREFLKEVKLYENTSPSATLHLTVSLGYYASGANRDYLITVTLRQPPPDLGHRGRRVSDGRRRRDPVHVRRPPVGRELPDRLLVHEPRRSVSLCEDADLLRRRSVG